MFFEDDLPRKKENPLVPRKLEGVSVEEMKEYIAFCESEIARAREEIKTRQSVHAAAEKFFK